MSESSSNNNNTGCGCGIGLIPATLTAMVGNHIHHSIPWTIVDFIFWPLAWAKWLICQEVNMTIIRETFSFFFK